VGGLSRCLVESSIWFSPCFWCETSEVRFKSARSQSKRSRFRFKRACFQSNHLCFRSQPARFRSRVVKRNGLSFDIPKQGEPVADEKPQKEPKQKTPRAKAKNDPRLVAAARELRDRWLERVNSGQLLPEAAGKYDVSRQLEATPSTLKQTPLLEAA